MTEDRRDDGPPVDVAALLDRMLSKQDDATFFRAEGNRYNQMLQAEVRRDELKKQILAAVRSLREERDALRTAHFAADRIIQDLKDVRADAERALVEAEERLAWYRDASTQLQDKLAAAERTIASLKADAERLDTLQRLLHDVADDSIGDVRLFGSWGGLALQIGNLAMLNVKGTVRDALDQVRAARAGVSPTQTYPEPSPEDVERLKLESGWRSGSAPSVPERRQDRPGVSPETPK